MKCSVAKDLIPLYAEGLCSDETVRELEEHFSDCEECRSLKESFSPPENTEESRLKFDPFQKIGKKIRQSKIVVTVLCLLLTVVLATIGALGYGELYPESGWLSFSGIVRNIEIDRMANSFAKGEIDRFAEFLDVPEEASDILLARLKSNYRDELSGQKCKITARTSTSASLGETTLFGSYVTFEFERAGSITVLFEKSANSKYRIYADNSSGLRIAETIGFIGTYDRICERAVLIGEKTENFLAVFGRDCLAEITEKYRLFSSDGSEVVSAFASAPLYQEDTDEFYCRCSLKLRDSGGNLAVIELDALLGNDVSFCADLSSAEILNGGISEEKLAQALEILAVSERNTPR
ncbi:MAG: zf-HC2 domain-containing protein [Acetatifactor sp.]|nr:zf-HC2 domain-containing protein [Acetatifactor sp.]